MKRFALITALCLAVTGAAVAQQDMGNVKVTGATYTTGVVESNNTDSMTFREDTGDLRTVLFDEGTVGALGHPPGSRVRVNFHTNEQDQAIADEIQGLKSDDVAANMPEAKVISEPVLPSGPAIEEPAVAVATPEPAAVAEPEPAVEPAAEAPLPRTGSNLYGLGLIGLLSLAAATVIRVVR